MRNRWKKNVNGKEKNVTGTLKLCCIHEVLIETNKLGLFN